MQQHCKAHQQGLEMNCPLKSQKPVPVKAAQVLLIQSGDEWLWQQRPNSGLWGGLWCLPIIEDTHTFEQLCQQLGLKISYKRSRSATVLPILPGSLKPWFCSR